MFTSGLLAIREKVLGRDSPQLAASLNELAVPYHTAKAGTPRPSRCISGRWPSAKKRWDRITPMWRRASTSSQCLYDAQGRFAEAEALYQRTLAILQQAFGAE